MKEKALLMKSRTNLLLCLFSWDFLPYFRTFFKEKHTCKEPPNLYLFFINKSGKIDNFQLISNCNPFYLAVHF